MSSVPRLVGHSLLLSRVSRSLLFYLIPGIKCTLDIVEPRSPNFKNASPQIMLALFHQPGHESARRIKLCEGSGWINNEAAGRCGFVAHEFLFFSCSLSGLLGNSRERTSGRLGYTAVYTGGRSTNERATSTRRHMIRCMPDRPGPFCW